VALATDFGTLPDIIGDGDRLAQVFNNLVDNSLKHTPVGGRVTVSARAERDQVRISVIDTGPGIPPEGLARIFERFYQLDKSRQGGPAHGVGLGLAIAKQIVQAHGGELKAKSQVGHGSTFTVWLPVARPDDPTLASMHALKD
jgi:two-component system sensor histidine kinase ResE